MINMRTILFSISLAFVYNAFCQSAIIPTPDQYIQTSTDALKFNKIEIDTKNLTIDEQAVMSSWVNKLYKKSSNSSPSVVSVQFKPINQESNFEDYYEMSLEENMVIINYSAEATKLYALSSLLQLINENESGLSIHPFQLRDRSKFSWRGLHLDVARHFFSVDELKRFIDVMSFYKFNKFHWHLTDDQGWRIEIKKYPLLTEIGGFRDSTVNGHYNDIPRTYNHERYGGFYTQEQIKDIVNYASIRGVTVVPEIEMPGHARAAIAAYPELSCTKEKLPVEGLWGVFDDIYCTQDYTINFMKDVLSEVFTLFPSEYIHIGGDEAPKKRWKTCEVCQNNIKKHHLKDEFELQTWFIHQIDDFITKNGRKLIGWDEILEGGLSPNAVVMSWQGNEGGILAANQEHEVIMTPVNYCYFDYYQAESRYEPLAIGGLLTLEKVYNFNPIPEEIREVNWKYILGAQANLWTEYIPNYKQVEYMEYPRALAMIENLWSYNKVSYDDFIKALIDKQMTVLKSLNVNFSQSFLKPAFAIEAIKGGVRVKATSIAKKSIGITLDQNNNHDFLATVYNDSLDFKREGISTVNTYDLTASENQFHTNARTQFIQHKGLGLEVDFITTPHRSFSKDFTTILVDGFKGMRQWSNNDWLGFNTGNVEFIVNLDEKITYKKVTVGLLSDVSSWIHLPKEIEVYASKDGVKWKKIAQDSIVAEKITLPLKKAKKLKFILIPMDVIPSSFGGAGYKPFTFIDELIFE